MISLISGSNDQCEKSWQAQGLLHTATPLTDQSLELRVAQCNFFTEQTNKQQTKLTAPDCSQMAQGWYFVLQCFKQPSVPFNTRVVPV